MKLTVDSFRKVCILQNYVGDINIAIMIVEDSHNADTYLDDKAKKDEQIRALRKKKNRQRSLEEMKGMKKKDLQKICKEAGISRFSRLTNKKLMEKIQKEEYSALVQQYKKKYYKVEQWNNNIEMQDHESYRRDALNFHIMDVRYQFGCHIQYLKWVVDHESYWIYNPEFEETILHRINFWERLGHGKDNVEYQRLVETIRQF